MFLNTYTNDGALCYGNTPHRLFSWSAMLPCNPGVPFTTVMNIDLVTKCISHYSKRCKLGLDVFSVILIKGCKIIAPSSKWFTFICSKQPKRFPLLL